MNSKRNPKCHLLNDWKEQIVHIGDEQVSLKNQFDNLRNDFSDNSPRLVALETGLNSLDGRVIITESDIISNTARITDNENDIDRIDAELVNKTGDINALTNRVSGAEADIDAVDGRVTAIETGEILYSQLTMDADKDFAGKAIVNPGLVDGVDVSAHTHDGTLAGGAKIPWDNIDISNGIKAKGYSIGGAWDVSGSNVADFAKGYNVGGVNIVTYLKDMRNMRNIDLTGNIVVGGLVDGVDISEHTHDGTAIGGAKVKASTLDFDGVVDVNQQPLTNVGGLRINTATGYSQTFTRANSYGFRLVHWPTRLSLEPTLNSDGTGGYVESKAFEIYPSGNIRVRGSIVLDGNVGGVDISAKAPIWDGKLDRVPTIPSDTIRHSHDSISGLNGSKIHKTITFTENGPTRARITYEVKGTHDTYTSYAEVRKNDVRIGTRFEGSGTTYQTITQDLTLDIKAGDKIQLWASTSNELNTTYVQNLRIKYDIGYSSTVNS